MGSSPSKPDPPANELVVEREKKLNELLVEWYETVVQAPPPPSNDPNLLRYATSVDYYALGIFFGFPPEIYDFPWLSDPPPRISVDQNAVDRTIADALANTTQNQTGQGYGTCVIKSFEGKYYDEACLFKLMVVAVSFNLSPSSSGFFFLSDVVFGYWIYFFRTDPPFRYGDRKVSKPIHPEIFAYKIPPDMSIMGMKYMTVEELDNYNP